MVRSSPSAVACLTLLLACIPAAAQPDSPPAPEQLRARNFVNDYAGVLSPQTEAGLNALGRELQQKTGAEIAVAVVRGLGDETVEGYSLRLADEWGVGGEGDRGALLLVAVDDRRLRLEVGYGLEPILPDGRAGALLDQMTPFLRQGDYDGAVRVGFISVAQVVAADAGVELSGNLPAPSRRRSSRGLGGWLPLIIILIILLGRGGRRGGGGALTAAWMLGSMGRGGRFGGFDSGLGGGGGFGGFGGGGFGGGGASRGW